MKKFTIFYQNHSCFLDEISILRKYYNFMFVNRLKCCKRNLADRFKSVSNIFLKYFYGFYCYVYFEIELLLWHVQFKLDRVILRDPSAGTVIPSYTDSYVIYDMQHMICLVNEIPKALKPPESAPMATSCSFINAKQIKTTNKS